MIELKGLYIVCAKMTQDVEMKEQAAAAPSNSVASTAPSTLQRKEPIKLFMYYPRPQNRLSGLKTRAFKKMHFCSESFELFLLQDCRYQ